MAPPTNWLAKLSKLKVDRARPDPAPHKPLLLLALFQRVDEEGSLPGVLPLNPELSFRFQTLWGVVAHRRSQRPDIRLPFHHLHSDGVWSAMTGDGGPSLDSKTTTAVVIDPDFASFVSDEHNRLNAKRVLIRDYFQPLERVALCEVLNLPPGDSEPTNPDGSPLQIEEAAKQGREARFRLLVVAAYNYTCALTGYRLTTMLGASIVDAAHIHRFADSRNNALRNGLALSKNAHWLFDQGLWGLTDEYTVLVAENKFHEVGPELLRLAAYRDRQLFLPTDKTTWPDPVHIAWHRKHVFERR